jgi:hypothetical protein
MVTIEAIQTLRQRLEDLFSRAHDFFGRAHPDQVELSYMRYGWGLSDSGLSQTAEELRSEIKALAVDIAGAARGAALVAEADLQDLRHNVRRMLAAIRFNEYRHSGVYVHHDEGTVLGVDPPSQEETPLELATEALPNFAKATDGVRDLIDLLTPNDASQIAVGSTSVYRPNTAFIMMPIDAQNPDLVDVKNGIRDVFKEFGIQAITADDIEHDDVITARILEEIETSEFLLADVTGERPNVYYEVGHAHARNKRVILYRKIGTRIHFDLAHRNCPEYKNVTELKDLLRRRLEVVTNRPKRP